MRNPPGSGVPSTAGRGPAMGISSDAKSSSPAHTRITRASRSEGWNLPSSRARCGAISLRACME